MPSVAIINKHQVLSLDVQHVFHIVCLWVSIVQKEMEDDRVRVEKPERCLSISYSCKVPAVGQSQFSACSCSRTLRRCLWLSVKQIGLFLHLAPR